MRLLHFLKERVPEGYSLRSLRWAIEHHHCTRNGKRETFASKRLEKGDHLSFLAEEGQRRFFSHDRILYEDEALLVYDKPAFVSTEEKLEPLLQRYSPGIEIVHRLDRDTTGALLCAKSPQVRATLVASFRAFEVRKRYVAIVEGVPQERSGMIELAIGSKGPRLWGVDAGGKSAKTEWRCEESKGGISRLSCFPITGRTHQIRIHLAAIGHPVLGDVLYSGSREARSDRPLLHAESLTFPHPLSGGALSIHAPLPQEIEFWHTFGVLKEI